MITNYLWKTLHRVDRLITPVSYSGGPRFEYRNESRHPDEFLIVSLSLSV
jgi:hypothetical protein